MAEPMDTGTEQLNDAQNENNEQPSEAASSEAANAEQAEDKQEEKKEEKKEPKPFVGLMANTKSVVAAVCRRDMDSLCSLLDKLTVQRQAAVKKAEKVALTLEVGHEATRRVEAGVGDGHTHDFTVFVRAPENSKIDLSAFIQNVTFELGDKFPKPERVVSCPAYEVSESGSESFDIRIKINFRRKEEPKSLSFNYKVTLEDDALKNTRSETITFRNVEDDFITVLTRAGVVEADEMEADEEKKEKGPMFPKLPPKSEVSQAIMVAITTKQARMLDRLLEAGKLFAVDLHMVDHWCPLICTAAGTGDVELFRVVLKHCTNIAVTGHYGNVLHSAIRSGNYELVQLILGLDQIDVKTVTPANNSTVLMDAVRSVRLVEVTRDDSMLEKKDKQTASGATNASGNDLDPATAVVTDCPARRPQQHDLRAIRDLLARGVDVNARDKNEKTALHHATMQGYRDVIELLLEHGADKHARDTRERTPWMEALFYSHTHLYDLLEDLENINKPLKNGGTYLHFAAQMCSPHAVKYLISKGADPLIASNDGRIPLVTAILTSNAAAARILAQCRPNGMEQPDQNGQCAMHHAMQMFEESGRTLRGEMGSILLDEGANVDVPDTRGQSALLIHINDSAILEWLLDHGANPDFMDPRGLYPLLAVCDQVANAESSVRLLLQHHVDMKLSQNTCLGDALSDEDHAGLTPLQIAVYERNYDLTRLLLAADACVNQVHDWLAVQLNPGGHLDGLDGTWHGLFSYIRHRSHQPMGLKGICRIKILKLLGNKDVEKRVDTLGLPVIMQNYLKWEAYIEDRLTLIDRFTGDEDSQT